MFYKKLINILVLSPIQVFLEVVNSTFNIEAVDNQESQEVRPVKHQLLDLTEELCLVDFSEENV